MSCSSCQCFRLAVQREDETGSRLSGCRRRVDMRWGIGSRVEGLESRGCGGLMSALRCGGS